jgi:hypothetical protein
MPWRIIFHDKAKKDFRQARDWYRSRSQETESRFITAVDVTIADAQGRLGTLQNITRRDRRIRVPKFPYCLILRELGEHTLMVVAVANHKRRSTFWRRRK